MSAVMKPIICLLLLVCVPLVQWASLGHAHGCAHPADHSHKPHLHLPAYFHSQPPVPDTSDEPCCHCHTDSTDLDSPLPLTPTDCHDEGVFYLPIDLNQGWVSEPSPQLDEELSWFVAVLPDLAQSYLHEPNILGWQPPRRLTIFDCPVYLRICNLLI